MRELHTIPASDLRAGDTVLTPAGTFRQVAVQPSFPQGPRSPERVRVLLGVGGQEVVDTLDLWPDETVEVVR